jgi:Asp-tRNA(Asn)/Glu-tRNA(Gln) amidotransferase A subunit family amidase
MPGDLSLAAASDLLVLYRTKQVSPVTVVEACLKRIAAENTVVNAYCLVDEERALEAAHASEARWARGEPRGALDGVPVSIKDLILTKDWPTLRGSRLTDDRSRSALERRRARLSAAEGTGRDHPRQDDDPGIWLEGRYRQSLDRHHPESL